MYQRGSIRKRVNTTLYKYQRASIRERVSESQYKRASIRKTNSRERVSESKYQRASQYSFIQVSGSKYHKTSIREQVSESKYQTKQVPTGSSKFYQDRARSCYFETFWRFSIYLFFFTWTSYRGAFAPKKKEKRIL